MGSGLHCSLAVDRGAQTLLCCKFGEEKLTSAAWHYSGHKFCAQLLLILFTEDNPEKNSVHFSAIYPTGLEPIPAVILRLIWEKVRSHSGAATIPIFIKFSALPTALVAVRATEKKVVWGETVPSRCVARWFENFAFFFFSVILNSDGLLLLNQYMFK